MDSVLGSAALTGSQTGSLIPTPIENLPNEVLILIFGQLKITRDLLRLLRVCKRWLRLGSSECIWKNRYMEALHLHIQEDSDGKQEPSATLFVPCFEDDPFHLRTLSSKDAFSELVIYRRLFKPSGNIIISHLLICTFLIFFSSVEVRREQDDTAQCTLWTYASNYPLV